jgi:prefoldin subunit 2
MASAPVSQEVAAKYQGLMQECQQLQSKIVELEIDRNEHQLVEKTLEPLDPERRAYRLVGGVLVERTVKEVLPSVTANRENLEKVIATLQERLDKKQKETTDFQTKHNLQTEATTAG